MTYREKGGLIFLIYSIVGYFHFLDNMTGQIIYTIMMLIAAAVFLWPNKEKDK